VIKLSAGWSGRPGTRTDEALRQSSMPSPKSNSARRSVRSLRVQPQPPGERRNSQSLTMVIVSERLVG
jgi:hypothetical protein